MVVQSEKADMTKPPWRAEIWCDADKLYLELSSPVEGASPQTIWLPRSEAGLKTALLIVVERSKEWGTIGKPSKPTQRMKDSLEYDETPVRRKPKSIFTDAQRLGAREILRKMGMI